MLMVAHYFVMLYTLPSTELFREVDRIFSKIMTDGKIMTYDPSFSISTFSKD
jgi:hypothetical protein